MSMLFIAWECPYTTYQGSRVAVVSQLRAASRYGGCDVIGFYRDAAALDRWRQLSELMPEMNIKRLIPGQNKRDEYLIGAKLSITGKPIIFRKYCFPGAMNSINKIVREGQYTLVHVHGINVADYWPAWVDTPSVLVPCDSAKLMFLNALKNCTSIKEKIKNTYRMLSFWNYEHSTYPKYSMVCPVSRLDAAYIRRYVPKAKTHAVGLAVEQHYFDNVRTLSAVPTRPHMLCCGTYNDEAIVEGALAFLENCYTQIAKAIPSLQVTFWGKNPTKKLKNKLKLHSDIRQVSWVEDYVGFLKTASVFVYPQRCGSGIQTKIQQAMALGIPVVAWRNHLHPLYVKNDINGAICNNHGDFSNAIISLLKSPAKQYE